MAQALPEFVPVDRNGNRQVNATQVKGFGSYVIPKIDVQIGATLQNVQGPEVRANFTLTTPSSSRRSAVRWASPGSATPP